MSVIFGIIEENEILIAADKRGTTQNRNLLIDNLNKIIVINEHLAMASAGFFPIGTTIRAEVDKIKDKEKITTDDLLDVIKSFYKSLDAYGGARIKAYPFNFLIAGKSCNDGASLISGSNDEGQLVVSKVPMGLFAPTDVGLEECVKIFAKNYKLHHSECVERTISEISNMSQLVSPTGDKWVYNIKTEKGVLHTF